MTKLLPLTLLVALVSCQMPLRNAAAEPQQVYRDASGRTIGTATTSGNQTIYRDDRGRTTGSATTDSAGNTVFRDGFTRRSGPLAIGRTGIVNRRGIR
jgi:YD repeat-containing protein